MSISSRTLICDLDRISNAVRNGILGYTSKKSQVRVRYLAFEYWLIVNLILVFGEEVTKMESIALWSSKLEG